MDPKKYFIDLHNLYEIERRADQKDFERSVLLSNLNERRLKGLTWYPVRVQKIELGFGGHLHITVKRDHQSDIEPRFKVGKVASLYNNSQGNKYEERIDGTVEAVGKSILRLSIDLDTYRDMPDWLDYGILGVDVSFDTPTYKKIKSTLNSLSKINSTKERLPHLRDVFLGTKKPNFKSEATRLFEEIAHLNESQNRAVRMVLHAEDIAIIHGPPGTGKTTTMVAAIERTLEKENQVLVTAPSNAAVDMLTSRISKTGMNVLRIGNPSRMDDEILQYSLEKKIEQHRDYYFLKKLRDEANTLRMLIRKVVHSNGKKDNFMEKFSKVKNQARKLEKVIVREIVDQTPVITSTLVGATHSNLNNRAFSTVFIDEAAQALEPICWIPITKAKRVILCGDHLQLPPVVKSRDAFESGLSETLFEKVKNNHDISVLLDTQYRMNEKIMKFSSQQFYEHQLKAAPSVKEWHILGNSQQFQQISEPLEFIDTAGLEYFEGNYADTDSLVNYKEADLLVEHLEKLTRFLSGFYPDRVNDISIGINSPYKAQINHLSDLLTQKAEELRSFKIEVNTIDGFQGQERDIIYISLVRSNLRSEIGFLSEKRRMNVALTRARKKLVVMGDSNTLKEHEFYKTFLTYIRKNGYLQTVEEWRNGEYR